MRSALFWDVTQRRLIVIYRRFGQPLNMGTIGCPETSLSHYQSTPRAIPKERRSHLDSSRSLQLRIATSTALSSHLD